MIISLVQDEVKHMFGFIPAMCRGVETTGI